VSLSSPLAGRTIDLSLLDHVRFGVGSIASLGDTVRARGGRAFVVTDPGVRASGVIDTVMAVLADAGIPTGLFAEVEPNPGASIVERGAAALRDFGLEGTVVVSVGGGSAMDTAKALSLRATNEAPVWELGYDDPALIPGRPIVAVVTTAGTGAETNSFGVITDEAAGRKSYVGHPSLLPVATILDPALTVGLPPAATAASGIDAMTHSLESLLSANPNPFAEAMALAVVRTVGAWLPAAVADGADLEARSRLLMASHLAGVGQASGTGVGLVHALGHALGTRGRLPHGTALAVVLPEVLAFYAAEPGLRDRELALVGVALGAASPADGDAAAVPMAIEAVRALCAAVDQRPTLNSLGFDEATLDLVAADAVADAAIRNSPRLATLGQARAILSSVTG
jgi:alcohol dehydrogenase class IV